MMKRLIRTVSVFLLCVAMAIPVVDARGRNGQNERGGKHQHTSAPARPGNSGGASHGHNRPGNGNHNRPDGGNHNRPGNGNHNRPGNGNHNRPDGGNHNRPGNGNHNRPGNDNHNRPDGGNHNHNRPGGVPIRPGGNHNRPGGNPNHNWGHHPGHGHGPDWGHNHGYHKPPPPRPYLPPFRPFRRPVPPPRFVPSPALPVFGTILNVAIGTALNASVSYWINNGYNVRGYDSDYVSLADVMQMGYMWPDATLYFNGGVLTGSEFVYSTRGYNRSRYNGLSLSLIRQYGAPVSTDILPGGGERSTWWGARGQYVTLSYYADTAYNGSTRYYTTLSFGN